MKQTDFEDPATKPTGMHPDDVASRNAQVEAMLRQVEGLLGTVSMLAQRVAFLACQLRGLQSIGQDTDPVVRFREEAAKAAVGQAPRPAKRDALVRAKARGRSHLEAMVSSGELVPASALAAAWKRPVRALVAAEARHELFSLRVKGKRYYIPELLHLESDAVAAICVSLYPMSALQKYFFWRRKHGSLRGQTVMERLGQGNWKDDLAAVLHLALGVSDQDRLGVAMGGDPKPANDAGRRTSSLLVLGPE